MRRSPPDHIIDVLLRNCFGKGRTQPRDGRINHVDNHPPATVTPGMSSAKPGMSISVPAWTAFTPS